MSTTMRLLHQTLPPPPSSSPSNELCLVYDTISATPLESRTPPDQYPPAAVMLVGPTTTTTTAITERVSSKRKRRRKQRSSKNKEEAESQRMTHIAVERNRRRLMNEHLSVLRSLMPQSYVQRGDQASIVGGAIEFVKELEQHLQFLEVKKRTSQQQQQQHQNQELAHSPPFSTFFSYPQYIWCQAHRDCPPPPAESRSAVGDVEVTVTETHANVRVMTRRRPRQLLGMMAGLQSLRLSVLHLNVTSLESLVLYSLSVKVEEGCNLTTVDDIAAAVHHMLTLIEADSTCLTQ